jgi:hypothetical protein
MIEIEQDYDDEGTEDASKDGNNYTLNVLEKCSPTDVMSPLARHSCEKNNKCGADFRKKTK